VLSASLLLPNYETRKQNRGKVLGAARGRRTTSQISKQCQAHTENLLANWAALCSRFAAHKARSKRFAGDVCNQFQNSPDLLSAAAPAVATGKPCR
jgi:hypothetical protein